MLDSLRRVMARMVAVKMMGCVFGRAGGGRGKDDAKRKRRPDRQFHHKLLFLSRPARIAPSRRARDQTWRYAQ